MRDIMRIEHKGENGDTAAELRRTIRSQEAALKRKDEEIDHLKNVLRQRESSLSWKLGQAYGKYFNATSLITKALKKALGAILPGGKDQKSLGAYRKELNGILEERRGKVKGVIVYPPTIDWGIPLFQRPQQLALELSKLGYLFFYCTPNSLYDHVEGFHKINDNCFVAGRFDVLVKEMGGFILYITSTDPFLNVRDIRKMKNKKLIVYDYIDEIHKDISTDGVGIAIGRHRYMKEHADAFLASASNLYEEAATARHERLYLIPNAVDYGHFHVRRDTNDVPPEMEDILEKGNAILGFYGALSSWVDYGLLKSIAESRPDYEIVLIGMDYDGSMRGQGLEAFRNIHYLGPVDYKVLPRYAAWFDVSMLPYVRSKVTESMSHIKLFEYMALGHPIVSVDTRECRKYGSVLIARDHGDFVLRLDEALKLSEDGVYLARMDEEARQNTWAGRASDIDGIIEALTGGK